jgi:hypothetical protein
MLGRSVAFLLLVQTLVEIFRALDPILRPWLKGEGIEVDPQGAWIRIWPDVWHDADDEPALDPLGVPVRTNVPLPGVQVETERKGRGMDFSWHTRRFRDKNKDGKPVLKQIEDYNRDFYIADQEMVDEMPEIRLALDLEFAHDIPQSKLEFTRDSRRGFRTQVRRTRTNNRREQTRRRRDRKSKGQLKYMAAIRFVNQSWGRVDEIRDFHRAIVSNVELQLSGYNVDIPLENLGWEAQVAFFLGLDEFTSEGITYKIDHWDIDAEGVMGDLFMNWATDKMIGVASRMENSLLQKYVPDNHFIRNMYGNPSTWIRRWNWLRGS